MRPLETANTDSMRRVGDKLEQALAASRHLRAAVVTESAQGVWRPAARWAGTVEATARADREIRLRHLEREIRASGPDADRRRRLRLAELSLDPATSRRLRLTAAEREVGRR